MRKNASIPGKRKMVPFPEHGLRLSLRDSLNAMLQDQVFYGLITRGPILIAITISALLPSSK